VTADAAFAAFCDAPENPACFEPVIRILYRLIHGVVLGLGGTDDHFEELASETALVLLEEIEAHQIREFDAAKRFTSVVVRNRFLTLVRSERRYREMLARLAETLDPHATDLERVVEVANILDLIAALEPAVHELLRARLVEQRPFAEIAEMLGISEGTARARYHRSLEKANKILVLHGDLPATPREP